MADSFGFGEENLIVDDAEFRDLRHSLKALEPVIGLGLAEYLADMEIIVNDVIKGGEVSDNLKMFYLQTYLVNKKADGLLKEMNRELSNFVLDIDSADRYLYLPI